MILCDTRRAMALIALGMSLAMPLGAQGYPAGRDANLGPMLDQGLVRFETPDFNVSLVRSSGTVAAMEPKGQDGFDFTPSELLAARSADGYYHLGDLDLRLRVAGTANWRGYSTAVARRPVRELPAVSGEVAREDLGPTFPADFPLRVMRSWAVVDGKLALRFTLGNRTQQPIEIGALGIPLVFDNIMSGKSLEEAHAKCSFSDPSIAEDGGYVQVTRLNGHGPALLVIPDGKTPLEAYRPIDGPERKEHSPELFHDRTPRNMTFEGLYEWMVASSAYQQNEWKNVQEWNPASSITLQPGEERTVGLRFVVAESIRSIESTLASNRRPVAIGIPGYVVPQDMDTALFLKYPVPVQSLTVEPAGALAVDPAGTTLHGWHRFALHGKQWGSARVTVTYADGLVQTIQYRILKPEAEAVADLGNFLFTNQWFDKKDDPFHRSPSVMSYDCQAHALVTEDSRVWIAGLSDEAGAGSYLAAAMKELGQPDAKQVEQLEEFVDGVLWGGIQFKEGPRKFGVRKSLYYYQPDRMPAGTYNSNLDWSSWESWNQAASEDVGRSFNYPHVVAVYWTLYRLARDHQGLVTRHDWHWYILQAYETTMAMMQFAPDLSQFGQMEGDVFVALLSRSPP